MGKTLAAPVSAPFDVGWGVLELGIDSAAHGASWLASSAMHGGSRWEKPARWGLRAAHMALLVAVAGALVVGLAGFERSWDPTYVALAAAVLVGAVITVPWRAGGLPSSLLIVPLLAAYWRFGVTAMPLVLIASVAANALRGSSWGAVALITTHDLIAFVLAHMAAGAVQHPEVGTAMFALTFAVLRVGLWSAAKHADLSATKDRHVDPPDLSLSLVVGPLGAVAVVAGVILGDGGLLLALAGLLPILCVVAEWWRLRIARAEAEAERDRLGRARELQEQLTHLITHEVRNPLTTVLGYSQLARTSLEAGSDRAEEVGKHLDRIYRAGKSIERLTENLLQLSKVENAGEVSANEKVDLVALARDVAAEMEPLAERKRQNLVLDLPDQAPLAWASPILLREALNNLVSNAVKYTPEGGSVRVWARSGPEPGTATLGVTDNGYGLSEIDQTRLFTKFFRSEDARVVRERGAGLGLALTQAIVQRMGGNILVESKLNEGATFRVQLTSAGEGNQ